jgi:predicted AlkP superfamily pyrophosphatase or phosphodiesterase
MLHVRSPICRSGWLLTGVVLLLLAIGAILAGRGGAQEAPRPLLLLISIDGLRPDYVTAADSYQAKIPHLRRFLKDGAFADGVEGVIPTVTYPSHTTLITGVWPAVHGILANTTFDPRRENQGGWYWYTEDIRVPTLWDVARQAGMTTASIQWPVSVGARVTWNIPRSGARTRPMTPS